jgi:DNA replication protein DnaC
MNGEAKSAGSIMNVFLEHFKNFEMTPEMKERELEIQRRKEENRQREAKEAEKRRFEMMRIPQRYRGLTLDNYPVATRKQEDVVQFLREYPSRKLAEMENLVLYGIPGTGKTHMICAFLQWQRLWNAEYWKLSDIMRSVKDGYSSHGEETELRFIKRLSKVPILAIDEVGRQGGTTFESSFMFDLIDDRYDNLLPTILVSNLPVEGELSITSYLGISVMDRVNENSLNIPCEWGNYRDHEEAAK